MGDMGIEGNDREVSGTDQETIEVKEFSTVQDMIRFPVFMAELFERKLKGMENLSESPGLLLERDRYKNLLNGQYHDKY